MTDILKIILLLLAVKSALFWTYVLQLKEYRLDRFLAEYGRIKTFVRFWFFSGGRKIRTPIWTVKSFLIFALSLASAVLLILPVIINYSAFDLSPYLLIYLLTPFIVMLFTVFINVPVNIVKNFIYFLARKKVSKMNGLVVIGITGSYGKSSTKEFLSQILSKKFRVLKTPGNINTEIGVSQFILKNLKPDAEVLIVEMGAYKAGEIKKICGIVHPKIGILTGVSQQHLALFGSMESIKNAKYELIESLPDNGFAVFNGENNYCLELSERWKGKKDIYLNTNDFRPDLPNHYMLNLSGAIEVAKHLGMNDAEIDGAVREVKLTDKMFETFAGKSGAFVINDAYSANPDGVFAAINYLSARPEKNKILVMPCLIELGHASAEVHKKIGKLIYEKCDFAVITTPADFGEIKKEAGGKAVFEANTGKVMELINKKVDSETAVLLEGRLSDDIVKSLR
jgi:UDP-N-acetylmuramoyl-tripeptide--D-alanyl-D-alanine ligase